MIEIWPTRLTAYAVYGKKISRYAADEAMKKC